jgi:anti-anti-sigma factor
MQTISPHLTHDTPQRTIKFHVNGDVLSTTVGGLRAELDQVFESQSAAPGAIDVFEVDLRSARMVDSVGLNLLVWLWRTVTARGGKLRVQISSPDIERTFQFTRLSSRLEVDYRP